MTESHVERKGILFPEELDIPDQHWYRIDFGSDTMWDLDGDGYRHLAHQVGVDSIETEIEYTGSTDDGIIYAAAECRVKLSGGGVFRAVAGADETSQQVRDPEFVWAVAGTRALKRAVKMALDIRDAESPDIDGGVDESGGEVDVSPPDDYENPSPIQNSDGGDDVAW